MHVWQKKQRAELERLRVDQRNDQFQLVLGGDGCFSQMGRSAVHGTYTVQDCSTNKIINVEQVHVSRIQKCFMVYALCVRKNLE